MSSRARTTEMEPKAPSGSNSLNSTSGLLKPKICSGSRGTTSCQPAGFGGWPGVTEAPTLAMASTMIARTVVAMMPIRIAPLVWRATSSTISSRPTTKTRIGQLVSEPAMPSSSGGPAATRRTKPASTKPIRAMNRPMPTLIAVFNWGGMALNTAVRNPVSTRSAMITPSRNTRPIADSQDICDAMP